MDRNTFASAIDSTQITGMRIIAISFVMGLLFFAATAVYMFYDTAPNPDTIPMGMTDSKEVSSLPLTLTIISLAYFISAIPLSLILFRKLLKPGSSQEPVVVVGNIRTAWMVRLAMLEGAGLLGVVAVFVGAVDGALHSQPLIWSGLLPVGYFLLHVASNLPSRDMMLSVFKQYFEPEMTQRS